MVSPDSPSLPPPRATTVLRWDLFCHVIDNYGDAGIAWRLARQLVAEQGQQVQLWLDDLSVLAALVPGVDERADRQCIDGVWLRRWPSLWRQESIADVVVETFGCTIPAAYIDAMAASESPVLWLNLEYLSAELWVEGCHGLPSKLPGKLQKYFFFPGFTDKTGGLLREGNLLAQRDAFQGSNAEKSACLQSYGVRPEPQAMVISLFSYEVPALASWLDVLSEGEPVCLLIPQGRVWADVGRWLGVEELAVGEHYRRRALSIYALPFVAQDDYDRLLWFCDFNIVRGEDSFVRAQWAGLPMLWHIYRQESDAHLVKLEAFLALYLESFSEGCGAALRQFWLNWNTGAELGDSWRTLRREWAGLQPGARRWCEAQSGHENISHQLVTFAREGLIIAAADPA